MRSALEGGGALQLTLDGREVPHEDVLAAMRSGPSELQREALRRIDRDGFTTASAVGRMVHAARGHCAHRAAYPAAAVGEACCEYGPSDGSAVLKALRKRGLVKRLEWLGGWNRT
jgi:hypothetical protein